MLAIVTAGCGSDDNTSSTTTSPSGSSGSTTAPDGPEPTEPVEKVKLLIGQVGIPSSMLPIFVGEDQGIFEKHSVEIETVNVTSATGLQALSGGSVDLFVGGGSIITAQAESEDIKAVASTVDNPFWLFTKADSDVKTLADLKGKSIAITAPGGSFDQWIRTALQKRTDFDLESDVEFLYVGTAASVIAAISQGTADAGTINMEGYFQVTQMGLAEVEVPNPDTIGGTANVYGLSLKNAEKKKEGIRRYFAALQEATAFTKDPANKDYVLSILKEEMEFDEASLEIFYQQFVPALRDDMRFRLEDVELTIEYGGVESLVGQDPTKFVDNSFLP